MKNFPHTQIRTLLTKALNNLSTKFSAYDIVIAEHLIDFFCIKNSKDIMSEKELLELEKEIFMKLIKNPLTLERIEHMLKTSKPLKN